MSADTPEEFRSRLLAIGYAVGRRDAMEADELESAPVPAEFAHAYTEAVSEYYAGVRAQRPILTEAYASYRETGTV